MGSRMCIIQYLLFDIMMGSRNIHGVIEKNCLNFHKVFDTFLHGELLFKVGQIDQ